MSMNRWFGMGRITKDIEVQTTPSGVEYCNFTIAVEDDFKPKDGSDRAVYFVDCVAWRHTATFLSKYSGKGRNIVVVGAWKSDKWEDKNGVKRVSWKVQVETIYFADSKKDGNGGAYGDTGGTYDNGGGYSDNSAEPAGGGFTELGTDDGELPF